MVQPVLGRITTEYLKDEDKVIRYIHQSPKAFMVMENPKTNRHFHFVVYVKTRNGNCRTAKDNYARSFKKNCEDCFMLPDGKKYSRQVAFTQCDENIEDLKTYLCKGSNKHTPPVVVINNGFIQKNEIDSHHQKFWKTREELKKEKPKTKYEKIMAYELPKDYSFNQHLEMGMKIALYHLDNNLLIPDKYQMQKMVETYLVKSSPNPIMHTEYLVRTYLNYGPEKLERNPRSKDLSLEELSSDDDIEL